MILLVEDNRDDERLAIRAVSKALPAVQTLVARDGREAIELLDTFDVARMPRFVFLDLKLPLVTGLDVLREIRLRESTRYLPVVVLTSSAEDRDVEESYRLGANCYLQKPVQFNPFLEMVGAAATFWATYNCCPASSA